MGKNARLRKKAYKKKFEKAVRNFLSRSYSILLIFLALFLLCHSLITMPNTKNQDYLQDFKKEAKELHQKQYTELPAFTTPPDFIEYSLSDLGYKTQDEKAQILSNLASIWDDIWPEYYDYAILVAQKMLKTKNYNNSRDYDTFVQYHLYNFSLKQVDDKTFKTIISRLDSDKFDLYRESALLNVTDNQNLTYEFYDRFKKGDFSSITLWDENEKKAFTYAWRIYNGYDDYSPYNVELGYYWFKHASSAPLEIAVNQYLEELEKAESLRRLGNSLEISSALQKYFYISNMSNPEKETLYHTITSHYFGHRDYELFANQRVTVAKEAYDLGLNTKSDKFLKFLEQIREFNFKVALWRISQPDFEKNIDKEIELLKNLTTEYEN